MDTTIDRPVSAIDPFSREFLRDPYPHHARLREAGPVVWLEQYGIWAMARHHEQGADPRSRRRSSPLGPRFRESTP